VEVERAAHQEGGELQGSWKLFVLLLLEPPLYSGKGCSLPLPKPPRVEAKGGAREAGKGGARMADPENLTLTLAG
jgi:hypothetical protein